MAQAEPITYIANGPIRIHSTALGYFNVNSFFSHQMVRNYKRTSTRGSYGDDPLGRSFDAVKNGDSVNKASGRCVMLSDV